MPTPAGLITELEPVAGQLLERHLATTKEWFPHELVPYSRGRDAVPGHQWTEADADLAGAELDDAVRSALYVNLLTEDNLPYYFRDVERMFGADGAYGTWARRWTAEEGRHSMVIYSYLMVTRAIDPVHLERGRMVQVSGGEAPAPPGPAHGLVYLTLQELATRIAHRATGKLIGDRVGYDVMARVAADENLHYLFYRDLATAGVEIDPSAMVIAMHDVVSHFSMPGTGIPDYFKHASAIAKAGIYDLAVHHDQILVPVVLRHWGLAELEGLSPEAEVAREKLVKYIGRVGRVGRRQVERREHVPANA
jgi:acyl-[acyl-carrier protein] desaturase